MVRIRDKHAAAPWKTCRRPDLKLKLRRNSDKLRRNLYKLRRNLNKLRRAVKFISGQKMFLVRPRACFSAANPLFYGVENCG